MTDPWPLRSSLEFGALVLSLVGNATRVLIEVRDADPRPPITKATNDDGASDGTDGLLLVAALSTR